MAFLFNWYDSATEEHITTNNTTGVGLPRVDYLATHPSPGIISFSKNTDWRLRPGPVAKANFSRHAPVWYLENLKRMSACLIDVCLFDYWGWVNDDQKPQSKSNTAKLVQALATAKQRGNKVPKIALFVETTPLKGTDLTTPAGGERLFGIIDDFYSQVPVENWALIDGKPLAMMYAAGNVKNLISDTGLKVTKDMFKCTFGKELLLSGNNGWKNRAPNSIGLTCGWGAGVQPTPIKINQDIVQISPGYRYYKNPPTDPRSPTPAKYLKAWEKLRADKTKQFVAIETWNEWHEASGIAESHEFGKQFGNITKQQIALWKKGL